MLQRALLFASVLGAMAATTSTAAVARSSSSGLRLRGGMATMAEQMAEIRARKAKEYAAVKDEHSSEVIASEATASSGAQADWAFAQDKIGPEIISTKDKKMEPGDARNIYFGEGVTVLRNKKTGMAIELMHESKGWFNLFPREGAKYKQISTKGIMLNIHRFYAAGLLEQLKNNPLKATRLKNDPLKAGCWKMVVDGMHIIITNIESPTMQIILTADSIVAMNSASNEAVWVDSSGVPRHLTSDAAQSELMGV